MLNQIETSKSLERILLTEAKTLIDSEVTPEKQSHYWYGGNRATIEAGGYRFHIEASGDVCVKLVKQSTETEFPEWDGCLVDVRDKRNQGVFGEEIGHYIKNDQELEALIQETHATYRLVVDNNNWWECFVTDCDGVWHDLMWNLDSSYLNEAVGEVLSALKEGLEVNGVILKLTA